MQYYKGRSCINKNYNEGIKIFNTEAVRLEVICFFITMDLFFAYVTQSGPDKTAEETLGVNYRSLNDLFDISQNRSDTTTYDVRVQMIEIYNEQFLKD